MSDLLQQALRVTLAVAVARLAVGALALGAARAAAFTNRLYGRLRGRSRTGGDRVL